jgi:hypothetical protein
VSGGASGANRASNYGAFLASKGATRTVPGATYGIGGIGDSGSGGYGASPWDPNTDPAYLAGLGNEQLGMSQAAAQRQAESEQALIQFGDPSASAWAGFGLDPQGADYARQNYLSGNATLARIDKSHNDARAAVINQLAGRGMLFSGETGYQQGQADQTYGHNVYDARNAVLAALNGYQNTYLDRASSLRDSLMTLLSNLYMGHIQNPGGGGSGGGPSGPSGTTPASTRALTQLLATRPGRKQNVGPVTATRQGF